MAESRLVTLKKQFRELGEVGLREIRGCRDADELESLRIRYLGKKGEYKALMGQMGRLSAEDKPKIGKVANEVKDGFTDLIAQRQADFKRDKRSQSLTEETIDITLTGRAPVPGHLHPLTQGCREITTIFREMGFEVASGPDLEDEFHNFEALNIPDDHPARDMQDTFYLHGGGVLRTHTSPVQIRTMKAGEPPLAIIAPGRVYRCDDDATHSAMFTQIEGFLVDRNVRMSDLKGVLERLVQRYFGSDRVMRMRPSFFPFTEPSAEIDILWKNHRGEEEWLEVLGAGMIHSAVLENVGYDPLEISGFAFGLGIERFVMLKHGITNIRHFYENDVRFLRQF
jgi:phenylalanyl-tRNA synthetase alpha chain